MFLRLILLLCFALPLHAASYYVSSAGSNGAAGTSTGAPWQTSAHVSSKFADGTIGPGDSVFFNGGDTFSGSLLVDPTTSPANEGERITIGSYGTGRAIFSPGTSYGVRVQNTSYVTVRSLSITGPGISSMGSYPTRTTTTTSTAPGVSIYNTATNTVMTGVTVNDCVITGMLAGIESYNTNDDPTISFADLTVTNNTVGQCGTLGIALWGNTIFYANTHRTTLLLTNVVISGNTVTDIYGITAWLQGATNVASGYGILCFNTDGGLVERNYVDGVGNASSSTATNGVVCLMSVFSTDVVFRHNIALRAYAPSEQDGNGIDLDSKSINCVVEYNFIAECDGAGMQNYDGGPGSSSGNIFRYNVVQNCGRGASLQVGGFKNSYGSDTPIVHNNTFYQNAGVVPLLAGKGVFANNIFSIRGGAGFGALNSASVLKGNTYHVGSGSTFSLDIDGAKTSLAALRSAGYEVHSAVNYGASGDPVFANAGNAAPTSATLVETISHYDISGASVAQGAGIVLSLLSITAQSTDFHGNASGGGVDSGAVAFDSVYRAPAPGPAPGSFLRRFRRRPPGRRSNPPRRSARRAGSIGHLINQRSGALEPVRF